MSTEKTDKTPGFDPQTFFTSGELGQQTLRYAPKETIVLQGDPADAVFYIEEGAVQIAVTSEHGKQGIIAQLREGEFFGEDCLAGQDVHMATASAAAAGQTTVSRIDKATMIRVLREQPALSDVFVSFLLSRKIQIEADLIDQLFNSSERRLARLLLLLADFGKEERVEVVIPKVSQETLAARVGTTRSRINFFMNKFRKLGLIDYNGGSLKVHSELLNVITHDPW